MELEADWPEGPHKAQLDALDDLARCPICHDFVSVPLTLGCGHACKTLCVCPEDIASRCHDFCHCPCRPCVAFKEKDNFFPAVYAVCSGCIRTNLEFQERKGQAKCPACREKCDARDLRPNHALKDLVKGYADARNLLVAAASQLQAPRTAVAQVLSCLQLAFTSPSAHNSSKR